MMSINKNIPLYGRNSFGINAYADAMIDFLSVAQLREYFELNAPGSHAWYPFGGGNNILFTGDYHGVLLHPISKCIAIVGSDSRSVTVRAEAGVDWDNFVEWCVRRDLCGVENLSRIPGSVGAAPIQNIGAYGVEVKDAVESVEVFMTDSGEVNAIPASECGFGYRDSIFKRELKGRAIILSARFRLSTESAFRLDYGDLAKEVASAGGATLRSVRNAVIAIRERKLPDPKVLGNAGSFFKNPVVGEGVAQRLREEYPDMPCYPCDGGRAKLAAGWLIDKAGWKGRREGNVGVHDKQALVIVNYGGATGKEILDFARGIQNSVKKKFGVEIEPEVNIL